MGNRREYGMSMLKERLMMAPDILEKKIKVLNGSIEVTIRRLTVSERDEILKDRVVDSEITPKSSSDQSCRVVAPGMSDPKTTFDELQQAPAAFVDEVAGQIMNFNGWTTQGKAAL